MLYPGKLPSKKKNIPPRRQQVLVCSFLIFYFVLLLSFSSGTIIARVPGFRICPMTSTSLITFDTLVD